MALNSSIDDNGQGILRQNQEQSYMIENRDKEFGDQKDCLRQFFPGGSEQ